MDPIGFVKKHPLLTGASVAVIAAVVFLVPHGGGGSAPVVQTGPTSESIAAGTQLQMAQIAANASAQQTAAQRDVAVAQIGGDVQRATLAAGVESQANVIAGTLQRENISSQTQQALAATESEREIGLTNLEVTRQLGLVAIPAGVEQTRIESDANVQIAQIGADAEKYAAKKAAGASKTKGVLGVIGGVLGGLFSDARLKKDVRYAHTDFYGVKWYHYRYTDFAQATLAVPGCEFLGVLAQELLETRFAECVFERDGFFAVNYVKLTQMQIAEKIHA